MALSSKQCTKNTREAFLNMASQKNLLVQQQKLLVYLVEVKYARAVSTFLLNINSTVSIALSSSLPFLQAVISISLVVGCGSCL